MPNGGTYGRRQTNNSFRHFDRMGPSESALAQFLYPFAFRDVVFWFDDFTQNAAANFSDHYTLVGAAGTAGAAFAKSAGAGGRISGATGTDDNEDVGILTGLDWFGDNQCGMELRWQVSAVTDFAYEVGFNDALTDTAIPAMDDNDTPTIGNGAADVALFAQDTDETLTTTQFVTDGSTANMNTTATNVSAYAPTAATYLESRVQIIGDAAAGFIHENYALKGSAQHGAVTASQIEGGIALMSRFFLITRSTTSKTGLIDYWAIWQNRRT